MKKKWLSRILSTIMAAVLVAGLLTGCSQNEDDKKTTQGQQSTTKGEESPSQSQENQESTGAEDEKIEITYPLDTKVDKLSIFVYDGLPVADGYAGPDESPFHSGLEKRTIDIDWRFPAIGSDASTILNLLWLDKEHPNIVYGACADVTKTVEWYEDGLIYDLTEYVPKYAPDYWEYINRPENAEDAKNVKTDDGKILALYGFSESDYTASYVGPVIRQDWLDECGLQAPRTLEEWENVLVKFKEKYNATFGFRRSRYNAGGGIASGVGAQAPLNVRFYLDGDKVCFGNIGPEWKAMLEVLHRWYDMGLLDPDFATANDKAVRAKALNGEIGVSFTAMSQLTNFVVDAEKENTGAKWVGLQFPATEVGAPITYHRVARSLVSPYGAVITKQCTEEELIAALQFLNYGYTKEGMMYHNFGEEGVTYTVDENGLVTWTELVSGDEGGIDAAARKYTGVHTGTMSTIQMEQFVKLKNSKEAGEAAYTWVENSDAKKYQMPTVVMTTEEDEKYAALASPISTYVEEMALSFITGKVSLDKYEEYEATLKGMGLQQCIDIQQAAVDRYFSR